MICKHCNEEIVVNTVRRSPEPFVYHPYKHKVGHLVGCFGSGAIMLRTNAEPKEESKEN